MTKTNLFLVTLLPAIPAGFLLFLLIGAFIGETTPSGMLQIVCGLGALAALAVALLPVGAFFFGAPAPPKAPKPAKTDKQKEEAAVEEEVEEEAAAADEWEGVEFEDDTEEAK